MLKNLIPFLQHFDKLIVVRTCSQQVRQFPVCGGEILRSRRGVGAD